MIGTPLSADEIAAVVREVTDEEVALYDEHGWVKLELMAIAHAVTLILKAESPDKKTGEWAGAIPTAPGASQVVIPERLDGEKTVEIIAPTVKPYTYVEIGGVFRNLALAVGFEVMGVPEVLAASQVPATNERAAPRDIRSAPGLWHELVRGG